MQVEEGSAHLSLQMNFQEKGQGLQSTGGPACHCPVMNSTMGDRQRESGREGELVCRPSSHYRWYTQL